MTEFSDRKVIYGGDHGRRIFEVYGLAAECYSVSCILSSVNCATRETLSSRNQLLIFFLQTSSSLYVRERHHGIVLHGQQKYNETFALYSCMHHELQTVKESLCFRFNLNGDSENSYCLMSLYMEF